MSIAPLVAELWTSKVDEHLNKKKYDPTRGCKTQFHWSCWMEWPGINQLASTTHQPLYFLNLRSLHTHQSVAGPLIMKSVKM